MDIKNLKADISIADVIGDYQDLRGGGRYLRGTVHDSLVVDTENQCYFWNSQGESGDVIDWMQRREGVSFRTAVERLCERAGMDPPQWGGNAEKIAARRARSDALTVAARHFVRTLRGEGGQVARDYCRSRGWSEETIREAGLGYCAGDRDELLGQFAMHEIDADSPAAQAALGIPAGFLVYPHVRGGRVTYLHARSVVGKRHYNPPKDLVGGRQLYFNWRWSPRSERVVVCEGPADAITWGHWGHPAIALVGLSANEETLQTLARHESVVVALDADGAGREAARRLCSALGARTRLLTWPDGIEDANDGLQQRLDEEDARTLLASAGTWAEVVAREAGEAEGDERINKLRRAFGVIATLDGFELAAQRKTLAELAGVNLHEFDRLRGEAAGEETERRNGEPQITVEIAGSNRHPDGLIGGWLLDLIYRRPTNGDGDQTLLVARDIEGDGDPQVVEHLDIDGIRYRPIPPNQMMREEIVQLPSDLGQPQDTRHLVKWIQATIHQYVDVDIFYEFLSAYYTLFTWLFDCFETLPYLRLLGDAGTGKSRFLQVVGALCYRPIVATGAATVSPMFRLMDRYRGTLLLDEGDFANSDETALVTKMLNVGYQRRQAVVLRAGSQDDGFSPEGFKVYGPKLIATRKKFEDWALESRCLTKKLDAPTLRNDIPIDLPPQFWRGEAPALRNALLRWRMEHWRPEIELNYEGVDLSLEPRLNQVSISLMTLIDDPDLKGDLRRLMQQYDEELILERSGTLECKVLESILFLHERDGDEADLSMKEIAARVNNLIDWENFGEVRRPADRENALKPRSVGHVVKKLGLPKHRDPKTRRIAVRFDEQRMGRLRRRYGLDDAALSAIQGLFQKIDAAREELETSEKIPL